jgi:predicted enzyme related to lactoylglutathione lyase
MTAPEIFRLVIPVDDIERATAFYAEIVGSPGERVWVNRHYFDCGGVVLACVEPPPENRGPRDESDARIIYFAVDDLDGMFQRIGNVGAARLDEAIGEQAWGERSFYAQDPFGNRLCFVDRPTVYRGGEFEE